MSKRTTTVACYDCDANEHPKRIADLMEHGWQDINRVQPRDHPKVSNDPLDWYTHIGLCAECAINQHEEIVSTHQKAIQRIEAKMEPKANEQLSL